MNKELIKTLFKYARGSIKARFNDESFRPKTIPDELKEKHGVFVTLYLDESLRGCIGIIQPLPLWKGVIKAARNSAFSDPRFMPLSYEEFNQVRVEISILSRPVKTTLDKIRESDGVIVNYKGQQALFLPQVWEQLPNKSLFIKELCHKAGLSIEWINKYSFKKFSVESWIEKEPEGSINHSS